MDHIDDPAREAERIAWTRSALADPDAALERASVDAGWRSYWRTRGQNSSRIVMDSPPGKDDVRPWLRIHAVLEAARVRVPEILARDAERGFLLLEDLGGEALIRVLGPDNADAHFDAAIEQLIRLQSIAPPADMASFNEALLQRDAGLFEDWFLGQHLGLTLDCADAERLTLVQRRLMDNLLAQPRVATHRDFMPRNLMPVPDGLAVIDFQDMVVGPIAYDPVSLFKDAFLSWPLARVDGWLTRYHGRAAQTGLPVPPLPQFLRDADFAGVQRHLKILGIFARLHYRDDKPRYLTDAPRMLAYVEEVVPRHAALAPLGELFARRIKPTFGRIWQPPATTDRTS